MRGALALLIVALAAPTAAGATGLAVAESEHYRLEAETSKAEAEEMTRVLEAAWGEFESFFGATPELEEGERLAVFFGATRQSFAERLRADGSSVPKSGGYYSPKTRTAYLWRQPTTYYTRCLLIHEASHQFHYLARTKNRHLRVPWYVEGLAEYLSRHTWDGERLELGVLPVLSLKDFSAATSRRLENGNGLVASVVEGAEGGRAYYWALVRFLVNGEDGRWRKRFLALARKYDKGGSAVSLFTRNIGDPAKVEARLAEWIEGEQEPWCQIFNEWEGIGPGRFVGRAAPAIVSACRVKAPVSRLAATLEVPAAGGWTGGLLLHHAGKEDYSTAMALEGNVIRVVRRADGKWIRLAEKPCPAEKNGRLRFLAVRDGDRVTLTVEGEEIGAFDLPGSHLGLAIQGCTIRYRDVAWE
jgi:hypothetical protein